MANTQDALNPCPLCGCHGVKLTTTAQQRHSIKCEDCPCGAEFYSSTKEQAIEAWNRRAALQPTEQPEAAQDERSRFEAWTATQRDGWEPISPFDAWQAAKRDAAQAPQERAAMILTDEWIESVWNSIDGGKLIAGENSLNWNKVIRIAFARALLSLSAQSSKPVTSTFSDEQARQWAKYIMRHPEKDHACEECGGSMVVRGFRCAFHEARALLADAQSSEKG